MFSTAGNKGFLEGQEGVFGGIPEKSWVVGYMIMCFICISIMALDGFQEV